MAEASIPGFAWGVVKDNVDPERMGRVKVYLPTIYPDGTPHSEWFLVAGWPGGGGVSYGSQYPLEIGAQVVCFFEHGEWEHGGVCFPGPYGYRDGDFTGPAEIHKQDPEKVPKKVILWEDDSFVVAIDMEENSKKIEMVEKKTGSNITLNATDGAQNKSVSVTIEANTGISIHSNGVIDIDALKVQINGRVVARKPGVSTI